MKKLFFFFVVFVLTVIVSSEILAKEPVLPLSKAVQELAVDNLLAGLESDNFGLKTSSAFMLGELASEKAVLPLMKILHTDANEDARIVAALALYKIGDERGLYAVKQAVRFDDSQRVSKLCFKFYNAHLQKESAGSIVVASK
ncbi:MAG: HEAT repeat domain-containing protein [Ignavibacteriales bacterium]|nr:MAG: HEAT repeat domain-containing protein [Ignavibacteriales bacterium]